MKKALRLLILLMPISCLAQQPKVPRDTSFTIHGTLLKERKVRPYIEIASPLPDKNVKTKTDLTYRTIGNRQILLDIFYPKKIKKYKPAVLLIFGGGWRSGDKSQNHPMAIALANKGYVAVSPEYRLSMEAPFPAAVYDLKAAVKWMKANAKIYGIDTNKITVLGCSAGGQLAALLGTTNRNDHFEDTIGQLKATSTVQAVIDIDGTLAFHHPESVEGNAASQWFGGTYAEKPATWIEAAPLEHVDKNTVPVLFINSSIPRFHAGRDDMIRKMDSLHIYSEVHTLNDTPHPFWFFHPWFDRMMGYIGDFLERQFGK
ncbi:MAG: alpha/beta hydrolase [Bacteroidota bacterium]